MAVWLHRHQHLQLSLQKLSSIAFIFLQFEHKNCVSASSSPEPLVHKLKSNRQTMKTTSTKFTKSDEALHALQSGKGGGRWHFRRPALMTDELSCLSQPPRGRRHTGEGMGRGPVVRLARFDSSSLLYHVKWTRLPGKNAQLFAHRFSYSLHACRVCASQELPSTVVLPTRDSHQ